MCKCWFGLGRRRQQIACIVKTCTIEHTFTQEYLLKPLHLYIQYADINLSANANGFEDHIGHGEENENGKVIGVSDESDAPEFDDDTRGQYWAYH